MTQNNPFFKLRPIEPVLEELFSYIKRLDRIEQVSIQEALGRVVATAPIAPGDLPEFNRSAMDGYAVRASDTFGASDALPAYLRLVGTVPMGIVPEFTISMGESVEIHTGGVIPDGADAVVMIERAQKVAVDEIEVLTPAAPGENIIHQGEDILAGDPIILPGTRIRAQEIGGLLAAGVGRIDVIARPRIAILSSGDELIDAQFKPGPGQIRDINAHMLAALVQQAGAEPLLVGIARDTIDSLLTLARAGFEQADMLVISAGSSVSTRDLTAEVIQKLGQPGIIQHGIPVKPGKPTIIATCNRKPVFGLPGNPVSAFVVAHQVLLPTIRQLTGERLAVRPSVKTTLTSNIASATGRVDSVPVRVIETETGFSAQPIFGKSNLIFTLLQADGIVTIPMHTGGYKAGTEVIVELFS